MALSSKFKGLRVNHIYEKVMIETLLRVKTNVLESYKFQKSFLHIFYIIRVYPVEDISNQTAVFEYRSNKRII